jgi:hypothetical protein
MLDASSFELSPLAYRDWSSMGRPWHCGAEVPKPHIRSTAYSQVTKVPIHEPNPVDLFTALQYISAQLSLSIASRSTKIPTGSQDIRIRIRIQKLQMVLTYLHTERTDNIHNTIQLLSRMPYWWSQDIFPKFLKGEFKLSAQLFHPSTQPQHLPTPHSPSQQPLLRGRCLEGIPIPWWRDGRV